MALRHPPGDVVHLDLHAVTLAGLERLRVLAALAHAQVLDMVGDACDLARGPDIVEADGHRGHRPVDREIELDRRLANDIHVGDEDGRVEDQRLGIVAALVTFNDDSWTVHHEQLFFDARAFRDGPSSGATGVDELASFQFGFPTAIKLHDGSFLATNWCVEKGVTGIRWTKFRIEW